MIKAGKWPTPPPDIPRWCLQCGGLIDPEKRSVSKFCGGACKTEFSRLKTKRDSGWVKDCRAADVDWPFHFYEPLPELPPPMSVMHAIRSNQLASCLMARKKDLVTDSNAARL